jgi:hypothetical protein
MAKKKKKKASKKFSKTAVAKKRVYRADEGSGAGGKHPIPGLSESNFVGSLSSGVSIYEADVVREIALPWYGTSPGNRNERHVDYVIRMLDSELWRPIASMPFMFDRLNRLRNGHTRCLGVIRSGLVMPRQVIYVGVTDEDVLVADGGTSRSVADGLRILGYKNLTLLASSVTQLFAYENGDMAAKSPPKICTLDAQDVMSRHPDLENSLKFGLLCRDLFPGSVVSFLHYLLSEKSSREKADEFFTKLGTGEDLKSKDPILVLRTKMQRLIQKDRTPPQSYVKKAMIIKTWNAWLEGRRISRMAIPKDEELTKRGFPKPRFRMPKKKK